MGCLDRLCGMTAGAFHRLCVRDYERIGERGSRLVARPSEYYANRSGVALGGDSPMIPNLRPQCSHQYRHLHSRNRLELARLLSQARYEWGRRG